MEKIHNWLKVPYDPHHRNLGNRNFRLEKKRKKQRAKAFQKVKLKRKAEKVEENRAKNETFKMEKEIQKIRNKEAQTTYKKDA